MAADAITTRANVAMSEAMESKYALAIPAEIAKSAARESRGAANPSRGPSLSDTITEIVTDANARSSAAAQGWKGESNLVPAKVKMTG